MSGSIGREKLVEQAARLKKAWLICVAMFGLRQLQPRPDRDVLSIADYAGWNRRSLLVEVDALEQDLANLLNRIVSTSGRRRELHRAARWLAVRFDRWQQSGAGVCAIATMCEFETEIGPLRAEHKLERPAYAEMLLQGWNGLALRHPEYHLARDLGLLVDLHDDAHNLLANLSPTDGLVPTATENQQSLARAAILACFNLLEAFCNGLARDWLMRSTEGDQATRRRLEDMDSPLRTRLVAVVRVLAGDRCQLDVNREPMLRLFGEIKVHRDSFVHCEPGPQASHKGIVKEWAFNHVPPTLVRSSVELTLQIIRSAWQSVHQREGPIWLTEAQGRRFGRANLVLAAPDAKARR